jgi:hypothetical protein
MADTRPQSDETRDDSDSDPAKGAEEHTDWSDEGGATPTGPATDSEPS